MLQYAGHSPHKRVIWPKALLVNHLCISKISNVNETETASRGMIY